MNKRSFFIGAAISMSMVAGAYATDIKESVKLTGSINIQGQKAIYDNNSGNNLDQLYGRINLGAKLTTDNFKAKINIRAYPKDFGSVIALDGETITLDKYQVENGWVQFVNKAISVKLGRFSTTTTRTYFVGNYLSGKSGGGFLTKLSYHNALELSNKSGPVSSSVLLGVGSGNKFLNTGYLRIYEKISPTENMNIGLGYRGNIFDLIHDGDAVVNNNMLFSFDYTIMAKLKPYLELGFQQRKSADEWEIPFTIGTTIPTGKVFDMLAVEMEYLADRKVGTEDKPVLLNIFMVKKINAHGKFHIGLFSDPAGENFGDFRLGLRFTGTL